MYILESHNNNISTQRQIIFHIIAHNIINLLIVVGRKKNNK